MVLLYCQFELLELLLLLLLLTGLAVAGRLLPAVAAPCFLAAVAKPRLLCVLGRAAAEADCCCSSCEAGKLLELAGELAACFMSCMYLQDNSNSNSEGA
jgi:hypothetical protein